MDEVLEKAKFWLSDVFDADTREKTKKLIEEDSEGLKESFYQNLAFGTGGMRGIMGVGTNRINKYTLGKNTQGLSNYLKTKFPSEKIKVAIAYDCRHNSKELAQIVANVFSANGIQVYLFSELRPTPELSYAVRKLECHGGIVLTASHNPPEYNGYKVYWQDGGQLVPPHDENVIKAISEVEYTAIKFDGNTDLITKIDEDIDKAFIKTSVKNAAIKASSESKANIDVVYTPLHGTSITLMPDALREAGFTNVYIVKEQAEPDGDFPTVESPNPEEPEAMKMAMELAKEKNADIVLGTDPDGDRLGIAVRDMNGELVLLNGNQIMISLTNYLLQNYGDFKGNEFVASTIVSTPLMKKIGEAYGVECSFVLTGFKWIAKIINDHPEKKFIGGGEESFGFMVGDFVRDKDAVSAILLACDLAASAKAEGSSFYEELLKLYKELGVYHERLVALVKKGIKGAEEIKNMIKELRENPPEAFNGIKVIRMEDYQTSKAKNMESGKESSIDLPKSNVLIFYLEDGSKIATRPSGTEPKIKFYVSVKGELDAIEDYPSVQKQLDEKIEGLLSEFDFS